MPQILQAALQFFAYLSTFLAWLNIGLCMHNTGTQWREMWISHVCLNSVSHCVVADRLSAYGTESFGE